MKKWLIMVAVLMIVPFVLGGYPACEDFVEINGSCTMITPTLACSVYNYSIINSSGTVVTESTLTNLEGDIYYFNFSQNRGDYVVKLCDGTTREITQGPEGDDMFIGFLILIPMLLGLGLLIATMSMGKAHDLLKIFLFLLSFLLFFSSMHIGMVSVIKFYEWPEMQEVIGTTVYWTGLILSFLIAYFLLASVRWFFHVAAQKKKERLEY